MRKYRILLVDDEEEIRFGIKKKIDFEKYGFTIIGDAENGRDALEKVESLRPDIIMTDVKMPFMDGLEFGKKAKEIIPFVKIIIFSGSDDFEYAKEAIKINVENYVLKPIDSEELSNILKKLKVDIDKEFLEKQNIAILKEHYKKSIDIFREKFLVSLIEGKIDESKCLEEAENLEIDLNSDYKVVSVVTVEDIKDRHLLIMSVKKIVDEILKNYIDFISFIYLGRIVFIGKLKTEKQIKLFIKGIDEGASVSENILSCKVTGGVGKSVTEIKKLKYSYRDSRDAIHYRVILGTGKAIYIGDIERIGDKKIIFDQDDERELINYIKLKGEIEIKEKIKELIDRLKGVDIKIGQFKLFVIEIGTVLLKIDRNNNLNILGEGLSFYNEIDNCKSVDKVLNLLVENAIAINGMMKKERLNSSKILIENAKLYIDKNFKNSELSVDKICIELHLSQAYFSTIFKKETGMNFVNYLTKIRLLKACELLKNTDYKTYIIAEEVGYSDANYFSYVFKREFNMSPSKYRKT